MEAFFEEVTPGQIRDFMRRTDPRVEGAISRAWLQSFLDNHLVPRDAAAAAAGQGRILDISPLVEKMIQAGIHKVTEGGKGMNAKAYKGLWPKTVLQPKEYMGRFDQVLLVDTTVTLAALVEKGNVVIYTDTSSCEDIAKAPAREDGTPLTRYVVFFQDGTKNKGRSVEDCRKTFTEDEIGLVTREGLYLPIQHEPILRDHGVDLPGSRGEDWSAPYVHWFESVRPEFCVFGVRYGSPSCGSASRGSVVIPVT